MNRKDTRFNTNILKGVLILIVLSNHFGTLYLDLPFTHGFANIATLGFFILSGYGFYYSFSKRDLENRFDIEELKSFYIYNYTKIFSLYCLYLLALLITGNIVNPNDLLILVSTPDIVWFLSALIICYFLAPFIYLVVKTRKHGAMIIIVSIIVVNIILYLLVVNFPTPLWIENLLLKPPMAFRQVLLLPVAAFTLGIAVHKIPLKIRPKITSLLFTLFIVFNLIITNIISMISDYEILVLFILFQFVFFLSIYLKYFSESISVSKNSFTQLLEQIGLVAFVLYLFHYLYYQAIELIVGPDPSFIAMLSGAIIFLPFLIMFVLFIDHIYKIILQKLR